VREIAAHEQIPPVFLRKVLGELRRHRILHSVKGMNGGYQLARPADTITLWELVQLLDAQPDWDGCLLGVASCASGEQCPVGRACEMLRTGVRGVLRSTTLLQAAAAYGARL
jgi:Rrf2 family protein